MRAADVPCYAGRPLCPGKRWLVTRPCRPACRIPFFKGGAAVYHPARLLHEAHSLPATALRQLAGAGADTWDCTQHAGEVVLVPALFLHATVNLDQESVAVAVQCDDGADIAAAVKMVQGQDAIVLVVGLTSEGVSPNDESEGHDRTSTNIIYNIQCSEIFTLRYEHLHTEA